MVKIFLFLFKMDGEFTYTNRHCKADDLKNINNLNLCGPAMTFDRKIITPKDAKGICKIGKHEFEYDVNLNEKFDNLLSINKHKSHADKFVSKLNNKILATF